MTQDETEALLDFVEGFESQADDVFATFDIMADEMAMTTGCKRLGCKARELAKLTQELCDLLSDKAERLDERLNR